MFRRARTMDELIEDKDFLYHIGQLTGAAEMVSHWMMMQEDQETKDMGHKLQEVVNWFFQRKRAEGERE